MKQQFKNPVMDAADPFVLLHDGVYYLYCTTENGRKLEDNKSFDTAVGDTDGFYVYQSDDLINWENKGLCLSKDDVIGEKWFWAPEVLHHNNRFYMIYTAEEHLAIAVSDSPLGPFTQTEKRWLCEEQSIDGHLFKDDDGTVYLYRVCFRGIDRIFVAKMSEDLLSIEHEYENCLIRADAEWETIDCTVAEGPFVLKHNGIYYLSYSANHTRCEDYAVGYATSISPVGPFTKYSQNPILHKKNGFCGVGHHSFTIAKDRKTILCAYHCHSGNPENFKPRKLCLNNAEFIPSEDGIDRLVIYGPESTL